MYDRSRKIVIKKIEPSLLCWSASISLRSGMNSESFFAQKPTGRAIAVEHFDEPERITTVFCRARMWTQRGAWICDPFAITKFCADGQTPA